MFVGTKKPVNVLVNVPFKYKFAVVPLKVKTKRNHAFKVTAVVPKYEEQLQKYVESY